MRKVWAEEAGRVSRDSSASLGMTAKASGADHQRLVRPTLGEMGGACSAVLVDEADHLEEEVGGDLEGLGADLVEGVLGGVVVAVGRGVGVGAVVGVDDVEDGDAALGEGEVVVRLRLSWYLKTLAEWPVFLAAAASRSSSQGVELVVVVDVEVLVADHVGDEEGLDLVEGAVLRPLGGEVAGAVEGVGGGPLLDGLFAVVEDQPDGVALGRMGAEVLADLDEQGGGAGAVVGADEVDVRERVVGLVVGDEDDDAVLLARGT